MVYTITENGYIKNFSEDDGVYFGGEENLYINTSLPLDFYTNFYAYKIINNEFILDSEKKEQIEKERKLNELRILRAEQCFPIVNRGQVWYNTLTLAQNSELQKWYQDWLDVTETLKIPTTPDWIK